MTYKIILVVPALHKFDAIGTDVLLQQECLCKAGHTVFIYAEQVDPTLSDRVIDISHYQNLIREPNNLIIYHFGVFWHRLSELISTAKARIWIKYHNITPPQFFAGWDEGSFHATAAGQNQAKWLAKQRNVELYVSDSAYNMQELRQLTGERSLKSVILAPMVQLLVDETFSEQSSTPIIAPDSIHVLFVGRVVPNKAHKHLLGTLRSFKDFFPDQTIQLHIAGANHPNFSSYHQFLLTLAEKAELSRNVVFWDKAPANVLKNLYQQATVFLCMSEHEGFCVPVIEAQQVGLPVLALARAAVPDTLGPNQLLLQGKVNYDEAACLIKEMASNSGLRQYLIDQGRINACRFSKENLGKQLLQLVHYQL